MKLTDYNYSQIENLISAGDGFNALMGLMRDLDLQVVEVVKA